MSTILYFFVVNFNVLSWVFQILCCNIYEIFLLYKIEIFFLYKILVKEYFVVGWFDALSDEILACSKYDFLGLEFGIRI